VFSVPPVKFVTGHSSPEETLNADFCLAKVRNQRCPDTGTDKNFKKGGGLIPQAFPKGDILTLR
jgi:hypothetical protein